MNIKERGNKYDYSFVSWTLETSLCGDVANIFYYPQTIYMWLIFISFSYPLFLVTILYMKPVYKKARRLSKACGIRLIFSEVFKVFAF